MKGQSPASIHICFQAEINKCQPCKEFLLAGSSEKGKPCVEKAFLPLFQRCFRHGMFWSFLPVQLSRKFVTATTNDPEGADVKLFPYVPIPEMRLFSYIPARWHQSPSLRSSVSTSEIVFGASWHLQFQLRLKQDVCYSTGPPKARKPPHEYNYRMRQSDPYCQSCVHLCTMDWDIDAPGPWALYQRWERLGMQAHCRRILLKGWQASDFLTSHEMDQLANIIYSHARLTTTSLSWQQELSCTCLGLIKNTQLNSKSWVLQVLKTVWCCLRSYIK